MQALTSLMRLRQAACSAELIDPALTIPSSKTQAFLKLADELIETGTVPWSSVSLRAIWR